MICFHRESLRERVTKVISQNMEYEDLGSVISVPNIRAKHFASESQHMPAGKHQVGANEIV